MLGKYGDEDNAVVYWWLDPKKEAALKTAMDDGDSLPAPHGDVHYR